MRRTTDVGTQLARSIEAWARARQCAVTAEALGATRWASATFSGARHNLRLDALHAPNLLQLLEDLPERDFAIRGHLVADVVTKAIRRHPGAVEVDLEILTLEDR